jgi:regulator of protease activity HflC (stomatin/prohibitin superfamily)
MLRRRLRDQYSNRTFVLLTVAVLVFLLSWVTEFRRSQIDVMDFLGLAEYRGRSFLEIMMLMDPRQSIGLLFGLVRLVITLLPMTLLDVLPAFVALAATFLLAARFVHTLYDTQDHREARRFLLRNMLGMTGLGPLMIVREGHIAVGEGTLYDRVGGRGLLIVYNDSAVVMERGGQLVRVAGPSLGFLKPFERIWEIVDLRHQRWPFTVDAMTKEGIPVSCEADITFKIDDRYIDVEGNERTKPPVKTTTPTITDEAIAAELADAGITEPLPYTDEAVFNAATSTWVRIHQPDHEEQLRRWTGRVMIGEVEGILRNIIARYQLDWLMRPHIEGGPHSREQIRRQLQDSLRKALPVGNKLGARILQVELGQIRVKDEIARQWVEAWQAGWEQKAVEGRAEGEAKLVELEAAQVQAQAEMVIALAEAIRPTLTCEEELWSYQLATRFIETMRWMSYNPWTRSFWGSDATRSLREMERILIGGGSIPTQSLYPGLPAR